MVGSGNKYGTFVGVSSKDMLNKIYTPEEIEEGVNKLAEAINLKIDNPCVWIILRGGLVFGADLIRKLQSPTVKFLDIERNYGAQESAPPREWHRESDPPIFHTKYRHVLVDVICETGTTFEFIYEYLVPFRQRQQTVKIALVVKGQPKVMPTHWHFWYKGGKFLTGYGMNPYRHLPYIAEHIRR